MSNKIVFLSMFAFCLTNINSLSLEQLGSQNSSEENQNEEILESLKEFVRVVEKYNLNVTIIGSGKKYGSGGWAKESLSVAFQMPVNDDFLTQATLDDAKQDKYLKKLQKVGNKDHVGAKTRVIQIENGQDKLVDVQSINPQYLIDSLNYEVLTNYENEVAGFTIPENDTNEILYNYILKNVSSDGVKNIQVITANVVLNELAVSNDFPADVLQYIKKVLPKLWLSINDETILARLLVDQLDKKYDGNFQVMIGVDKFALGGRKYANLKVADTNVLVFT